MNNIRTKNVQNHDDQSITNDESERVKICNSTAKIYVIYKDKIILIIMNIFMISRENIVSQLNLLSLSTLSLPPEPL